MEERVETALKNEGKLPWISTMIAAGTLGALTAVIFHYLEIDLFISKE